MSQESVFFYEYYIDMALKIFSISFRVSVLGGGAIFLVYCYSISYFPEGVTVGDALALIFISVSFSVVCVVFVASLYGVGATLYPVWFVAGKAIRLFDRRKRVNGEGDMCLAKPSLVALFFSFPGFLILVALGSKDLVLAVPVVICAWFVSSMWESFNRTVIEELDAKDGIGSYSFMQNSNKNVYEKIILDCKAKKARICLATLFIPLVACGISATLLQGSFLLLSIKSEGMTIHVKEPYGELLKSYGLTPLPSSIGKEYLGFKNVSILLKGVGKSTVVAPDPAQKKINVAIPNSSIIVHKSLE